MEDYKTIFEKKIFFVIQMVDAFGVYKVPLDYFCISVESRWEFERVDGKERDPRTTFKMKDLFDEFPDEVERLMKACGIKYVKSKESFTFSLA